MEYINDFVRNIIIFILFINIGGVLISDGDNRKIYKFISGLIMIVIVMHSIFNITGIDIDDIFKNELSASTLNELKNQINANNQYIKDNSISAYEQIIKENVSRIVEVENYKLVDIVTTFDDTGNPTHIDVWIEKKHFNENKELLEEHMNLEVTNDIKIEEIKQVTININNMNDIYDNTSIINKSEMEKYNEYNIIVGNIRKNIFILYGIKYENINIYINEVEDERL